MRKIFLNWRGPAGPETVYEFEPEPGQSREDFRRCIAAMISEYQLAGMAVYQSSRPCKGWN